jgi:acyl-CoA synthetase (AMP-forming)/AMP-acid ligase II
MTEGSKAKAIEAAVAQLLATDPRFAVERVRIRGDDYTAFSNIPAHTRALLDRAAEPQASAGDPFLVFGAERQTYEDFRRQVNRLANALEVRLGVTKGQPVAIAMRNCPELMIAMMAITSLGAVAVFLNAWWTTEELDYALGDSKARIVFADGQRATRLAPLVDRHGLTTIGVRDGEPSGAIAYSDLMTGASSAAPSVEIDTDDDMAIMYSSGTTGQPKGVVQTHRGAMNAVQTWLMQVEIGALIEPPAPDAPAPLRPAFLVVTPLFHVTATHPVFLLGMAAGAKLVVMEKWDAELAVQLVEREQITRILGVPTQSADLMQAATRLGASLGSLNFIGAGGAKRPAAQVSELTRRFPAAQIATGWGMTETNANGIGLIGPEYHDRPNVAGRLYPPVQELRFLDDAGHEVLPGTIGEITVKSPCNMRCYLNKPEATADVLQNGWLRTGDLGSIDEDGIVTISDRKKNIIIRGGENIACLDVEGAVHRHPAVAEACAFSVPHDRLGEVVGIGILLKPGETLDAEALRSFLADHIARFKIPEHVWLLDGNLPRGTTDKLDRRALRQHCLSLMDAVQNV